MRIKRTVAMALSAALVCMLCVGAWPKRAHAASHVYILGKLVNAALPYYTNGPGGAEGILHDTSYTGAWNARFDAPTNTLYLNGFLARNTIVHATIGGVDYYYAVHSDGPLKIVVSGTGNELTAMPGRGGEGSCGLLVEGDLEISGSGTLTTTGSATVDFDSYGLWCAGGGLTVGGGCTVIAQGGNASGTATASIGAAVTSGALAVSGGSHLTGTAQAARESIGVGYAATLTVSDASSVEGRGGAADTSVGIQDRFSRAGAVQVSDSARLTGIAGSAVVVTGVEANGGCTVSGGTFIADASAGTNTRLAVINALDAAGYANYRWRTSKADAYTESGVAAYVYDRAHAYVEIVPGSTVPVVDVASAAVPKTGDGTPLMLLVGLALFSGAGLALRASARRRRARSR